MTIQANRLLRDLSIEMTAKDVAALEAARPHLPARTPVSITYLPHETYEARVAAAGTVRRLGLTPVPHISARRLRSLDHLDDYLFALSEAAAVERVFVIAGDMNGVEGPFPDSLSVIRSGRLERHGIHTVGVAGHPGGHGQVPVPVLWRALADKAAALRDAGLAGEIVTQFSFEAETILGWLEALRERGIGLPVRIGLPGPANMATLMRFAARCGVETSAKVLARYGVSMGRLIGSAGPDRLLEDLAAKLEPGVHGAVRVHLYPFGGLARTAEWAATRADPATAHA